MSSAASPVVSDAKHAPGKPVKQEDSKGDSAAPPVSGISADALNRLIAMGGPAGGFLLLLPSVCVRVCVRACVCVCTLTAVSLH